MLHLLRLRTPRLALGACAAGSFGQTQGPSVPGLKPERPYRQALTSHLFLKFLNNILVLAQRSVETFQSPAGACLAWGGKRLTSVSGSGTNSSTTNFKTLPDLDFASFAFLFGTDAADGTDVTSSECPDCRRLTSSPSEPEGPTSTWLLWPFGSSESSAINCW